MLNLTLTVLLQTSLVAAAPESANSYDQAYRQSIETGKPLLILVGADWCPACQTMKTSILPQVERNGALRMVEFAVVNSDHQSILAKKLMSGGAIPQLILFEPKSDGGWKRHQLTGGQSVQKVADFIESRTRSLVAKTSTTQSSK
jgi:thioredoxin-like negative regulator of GroEL